MTIEPDAHIQLERVEPHGTVTEAYYRIRFDTVTAYVTPQQCADLMRNLKWVRT